MTTHQVERRLSSVMANKQNLDEFGDSEDLEGLTLGNVDLKDYALVERIEKRDLNEARIRIQNEVRRLQELGVIDFKGKRINKELPPDMQENSNTDFGG